MGTSKTAILDLGTNTFHLLIAELYERDFKILLKEKIPVKIGQGGINRRILTREAKERALDAILNFKRIIERFGITDIHAYATSAIRTSYNGTKFIREIYQQSGIPVKIISGTDEAQFIYQGVRQAADLGDSLNLIMDIGGGSVEFIIGNAHAQVWKKSFEIGAQRLTDKYHKHDPVRPEDLIKLNRYLSRELKPLILAAAKFKPDILVGSSGTFDTLSEIYSREAGFKRDPSGTEFILPVKSFFDIYEELENKNRQERLEIPGMTEMRVDMIVMSVALIHYIITRLGIHKIKTSAYSLKEGILYSILEKNQLKKLSA